MMLNGLAITHLLSLETHSVMILIYLCRNDNGIVSEH